MEDSKIVELYFDRDERAISETAKKYGKLCMQVSMHILSVKADAEECVNDTYLKTWQSIPPARPTSLGAYVCRIARNLSVSRLRRRRRARSNADFDLALHELETCIPMPEESSGELTAHLEAFLLTQEPLNQKLFVGRYFHAYPVSRMAKAYGLTEDAVSSRLYRVREKLRVYLTERGYSI